MLQIAPSGYWCFAAAQRNPALSSRRAQRDEALYSEIQRVWQVNKCIYGVDKVRVRMNREGIRVARCTVERLMGRMGLHGVPRGMVIRTSVPETKALCPLDRASRVVQGRSPQTTVGLGLHLRLDLAGLAVRGLRDRSLRPAHSGLTREQPHAYRPAYSTPWSRPFTPSSRGEMGP